MNNKDYQKDFETIKVQIDELSQDLKDINEKINRRK